MKKKQVIVLVIWYACYMIAMAFFRFKFGAFGITAFFLVVGIPLMFLLGRTSTPK